VGPPFPAYKTAGTARPFVGSGRATARRWIAPGAPRARRNDPTDCGEGQRVLRLSDGGPRGDEGLRAAGCEREQRGHDTREEHGHGRPAGDESDASRPAS